jgi:uncharacterized RDD family membrane protein YckC
LGISVSIFRIDSQAFLQGTGPRWAARRSRALLHPRSLAGQHNRHDANFSIERVDWWIIETTNPDEHDVTGLDARLNTTDQRNAGAGLPCGLGRRVLAIIYDALVVVALLLLATALALLAGSGNVTAGKDPLFSLYLLSVWFLYFAWCWRRGGMTVGMRAWRIALRSEDGSSAGWGQCAIRFLVAILSAACLFLGFFWSLFDSQKRAWHDRASRTVLIRR